MDKLDKIKELIKPYSDECNKVDGYCNRCSVSYKCNELNSKSTGYAMRGIYELLHHLESKI